MKIGYELFFVGTTNREQPVGVRRVVHAMDVDKLAQLFECKIARCNSAIKMTIA